MRRLAAGWGKGHRSDPGRSAGDVGKADNPHRKARLSRQKSAEAAVPGEARHGAAAPGRLDEGTGPKGSATAKLHRGERAASEEPAGAREGLNVEEMGTALEISQPKQGKQSTPQGASRPEVGVMPRGTDGGPSAGAVTTGEGIPRDPNALMERVVARASLPEWQAQSWAGTRKGDWRMARGPLSRALDTADRRRQGLASLRRASRGTTGFLTNRRTPSGTSGGVGGRGA